MKDFIILNGTFNSGAPDPVNHVPRQTARALPVMKNNFFRDCTQTFASFIKENLIEEL